MPADDAELWQLLRSLDDPDDLEFPADYHHRRARACFERLAQRLDTDFDCRCDVDRNIQDASLHGRIGIPTQATATGRPLVISVSNFGGLTVLSVDNPGVWTDAEAAELLHPDDTRAIHVALADLGSSPKTLSGIATTASGIQPSSDPRAEHGGTDTSTTSEPKTVRAGRCAYLRVRFVDLARDPPVILAIDRFQVRARIHTLTPRQL